MTPSDACAPHPCRGPTADLFRLALPHNSFESTAAMWVSKKYILVCDERGTTRWPSSTKTWALGGFITDLARRGRIISAWKEVKRQLCGDSSCELKWSHFFPGRHQDRGTNPLISDDPEEWRQQASWAIDKLFEVPEVVPINTYVRKDEASDAAFKKADETSEKEYRVLDIDTLFVGPIGQLAVFLMEHRGRGEIWFDKLGSEAEEQRRQHSWQQLRDGECKVRAENQKVLKSISRKIKFLDSQTDSLVQIADFISGVIWAASEGDEMFLLQALSEYFPTGPGTYTLLRIT